MSYDPILGVRYTFDKEQPTLQQTTNVKNTKAAQIKKELEQVRVKQALRNNTKQK